MSPFWIVVMLLIGLGFVAWFMTATLRVWSKASVRTTLRAEAKLGGRLALSVELIPSEAGQQPVLPDSEGPAGTAE